MRYPRRGEAVRVCESGRVVCIQVDGTFQPPPKADPLVRNYKLLKLRVATYAELGRDD